MIPESCLFKLVRRADSVQYAESELEISAPQLRCMLGTHVQYRIDGLIKLKSTSRLVGYLQRNLLTQSENATPFRLTQVC